MRNYNDIYHEVERVESLSKEEILEDNANYKSDLLSIKASSLHKITTKLEVLHYKDIFSISLYNCTLEKGIKARPWVMWLL